MALTLFNDPIFSQMETAMDRALQKFYGRDSDAGMLALPFASVTGTHEFDIIEHENEYLLHADAPGFHPEDIHIELQNNMLTIHGEKKEESKPDDKKGRTWRKERRFRSFTRLFQMPDNAKPDQISATLDKGVLTVKIPKVPEQAKPQPKRITVNGSGAVAQTAPKV